MRGVGKAEILWDRWGVPHVYATSDEAAFRALGWAQARAHGPLLLRQYGLARGRGAELWGERYLESDRLLRRLGVPARSRRWAGEQSPAMRARLEAFVAGVNACAEAEAAQLGADVRAVLPVTVDDLFAHIQRVYFVYLTITGQRPAGEPLNELLPLSTLLPDAPSIGTGIAGSNAWALSGARTASGAGLLLANPHLYWGDAHTLLEAHLNVDGEQPLNLYGVAQVGWPVLRYGFNDRLGWAHTVNTLKGWDAFALEERDGGYVLDGELHAFDVRHERVRVRGGDGILREEPLEIRRTRHGPVLVQQEGRSVAVRCVGLEVGSLAGLFDQYWAMARARTHAEFEAALVRHQNALFTVLYADGAGRIAHYFTGFVPRRAGGSWGDWAGTLPGDRSDLIWTDVHDFAELPRVVDPPSGFLQNANNAPWLTTLPPELDPDAFPAYLAPRVVTPREQRSLRLISPLDGATVDDVARCAYDTRSETADRLLPELLALAQARGGTLARETAGVLARWDRRYASDSVGADLFARWLVALAPAATLAHVTANPWSAGQPLDTPGGLADGDAALRALEGAAGGLLAEAGTLERPWGMVTRARRGGYDVPGHGHLDPFGVFRVSGFAPAADGAFETGFGTGYVAVTEFTRPVRARVLLSYGNSSRPESPHYGDQLPLFSRGELRDALLTREAVEAELVERELV
ncbi:MAG: penicillin acylase family protein [Thermoleophilia bacterium]|nr:penicillin acylase family protein [Thermoleophilia bacterium]